MIKVWRKKWAGYAARMTGIHIDSCLENPEKRDP
jgi:hypothetical protein